MRKVLCLLVAGALISIAPIAWAVSIPACIETAVPNAALVGEGRMQYMMMDIYDARLYAPDGVVDPGKPMALSLTYLRRLKGERIADRSVAEIRRQGFKDEIRLAGWNGMLRAIFPDVEDGTTLTGVMADNGATVFYRGNAEIGRIADPAFGRLFFSIWLGPDSSDPKLRAELLNHTG